MADILVTGASGFIGGQIAGELSTAGHRVLGVGRADQPMFPGAWTYQALPGGQALANQGGLDAVVRGFQPEYLLHCAGTGRVDWTIARPAEDFASGPGLTFALVDALRRLAPRCVTIYISSAAVHGAPQAELIGADTPLDPISPYGFHKLICETILREFKTVYGLDSIVLRVLSCYGAGLRKQILWDICQKARTGRVELFGTGQESRDFIHVRDLARLAGLLVGQGQRSGVFPVGSGRGVSMAELARMLLAALGLGQVPVVFKGVGRQGDPSRWLCDVVPLAGVGFRTSVGLEEGVAEYAQWFARLGQGVDPDCPSPS